MGHFDWLRGAEWSNHKNGASDEKLAIKLKHFQKLLQNMHMERSFNYKTYYVDAALF